MRAYEAMEQICGKEVERLQRGHDRCVIFLFCRVRLFAAK